MTERPILFNSEMVRAILEGRKTQTRRPVKPLSDYDFSDNVWRGNSAGISGFMFTHGEEKKLDNFAICPYGQPEDELWVRETFCLENNFNADDSFNPPHSDGRPIRYHDDDDNGRWWEQPHYRATDPAPELCYEHKDGPCVIWKPSIYMPRWASRIQLRITNVSVERVQEINDHGARMEGVKGVPDKLVDGSSWTDYRGEFKTLWDSINQKRGYGWDKKPWVWVVEFEVIK